ncbi:GTP 3',8-cyclase MoaA [uncultured Megasphaera sp.]|uniref:GTP 3',8-cyclase MoaA n=1 Tax=uncultured Megasphaera sp. TaxID=165188 RepID=UPI002658A5B6|nr:GTP 3',8-cyclase MoaA [uncultured Megasphaera sp.]
MIDSFGRTISYLRISVTENCNLCCRYCRSPQDRTLPEMPLSYEALLTICQAAVRQGIRYFKVTGGEPLLRPGILSFLRRLKQMAHVESVTITTNGILLPSYLPELQHIGIDGINISLDTLDERQFSWLTGGAHLHTVLKAIRQSAVSGISTKVNAVLLTETCSQVLPLARLAENFPVDLRFIELMPIGKGAGYSGNTQDEVLQQLRQVYSDLTLSHECRGHGPAVYYRSAVLQGRIGFISANSHSFCPSCNRMRLTSLGFLKPCLCYGEGIDLRPLLAAGREEGQQLDAAFCQAARNKPKGHCFSAPASVTERRGMNVIGG